MKGVVITELLDMIERRHGIEVLDSVLTAASPVPDTAYRLDGTYDWREFAALVAALGSATGLAGKSLLRGFGQHLFAVFAARYPGLLAGVTSPLDLLADLEGCVYPEVLRQFPDAELPRWAGQRSRQGLVLHYTSPRPFGDFALGLIEGCLLHYGTPAQIRVDGEGGDIRFTISLRQEERCPTSTR